MVSSPQWKMAVDVERCIGCHACSVACKVELDVPLGVFPAKVYYLDEGTYPQVKRHFLPTLCMQCEDAPCIRSCPSTALELGVDGIVRVNDEKCVGTGACEASCPYGAIWSSKELGAIKCDMCSNRLEHGMEPACVETCPTRTLVFGDATDPTSEYSLFMVKKGAETRVLKPEENTKPRVTYRGHNPNMEAKIPKGRPHDPESYELETWSQTQAAVKPPRRG